MVVVHEDRNSWMRYLSFIGIGCLVAALLVGVLLWYRGQSSQVNMPQSQPNTLSHDILDLESQAHTTDTKSYMLYSIPEGAVEKEGGPVDNGTKAKEYWVGEQMIGSSTHYLNGQMAALMLFKDGKQHGPHRGWYENGQLRFETFYNLSVPIHSSRQWYDTGQLHKQSFFKSGKRHGKFKQWSRDGRLLGVCQFNMGTGIGREWHENGNLQREIYFTDDQFHGLWREWDENGSLKEDATRFYIRGKNVEKDVYIEAQKKDPALPKYEGS